MNSGERIGEASSQVVSVSPVVLSQTKVEAEKADEDTHEDCLMPVDPVAAGDEREEGEKAQKKEEYYDEDGAVHFGEGGLEGREVKVPAGIPEPSAEMVRKHRKAGHCPYRPWCAHCVKGAANAPGHKARNPVEVGGTPEVHCDYAFFRDRAGDKENTVTVLVTKDRISSGVTADVVPKKGAGDGYAVKQLERNIKKYGNHGKIVLRSDGEVAIKDLLQRVAAMRASQTVLEHTPTGDSRANGRVERAVQQVEKQTRVLKLAVEEELGAFSVRHPAFTWLVMHAADVYNKFHVGADGRTAYERIRGRAYSGEMYEFGQCMLYKTSCKVQGGDMGARWMKGIWLGKRFTTEEHILATTEGLVAVAGAVRAHPEVTWDSQLFDGVIGVPWDPLAKNRGKEPEEQKERIADLPRVVVPRRDEGDIPRARNLALTSQYFEKYGWSPECRKCQMMQNGDSSQPTLGHSLACRLRIEGLLRSDPKYRNKVENARLRQDEYLAKRIEAGDQSAKQARIEPEALHEGPKGKSEVRIEEKDDEEMRPDQSEGGAAPATIPSRTHSRVPSTVTCMSDKAPSTVTCATDLQADIPIPNVEDVNRSEAASSSSRPMKRKFDGPEGDEGRAADPDDPQDAGMVEVQKVLMLGERSVKNGKPGEFAHGGIYDLVELFSPPRVAERARARGLRGGWSLDKSCEDPVTGQKWNLSDRATQGRVWKMIRRDQPTVIGLSPE